ncbi:MAG: Kazal-type serine protease inhibitor [Desulfobacteraceae bacterium]|nr:Kazal-type serine protease inhibitor [Desulfobacteraceae bacterium]
MVRRIIISVVVGLLVFACYPAQEFQLGTPFQLNYRETLANSTENIRIRFDKVISDERCPIEHFCLLPGNAEVELTFWKGSQKESFVLNTGEEPRANVVLGYTIRLMELTPPRSLNKPVNARDYVVTVSVSKAGRDCIDNTDCALSTTGGKTYCKKKDGQCEAIGQCEAKPDVCPQVVDPICGCDGRTYGNACMAAGYGVNVAHKGDCEAGPRDESCDDGTAPLCDRVIPACSDYEILAYQNNCYRCVNPATCLPWGQANCKVDGDCPQGHACVPCGTSSCPFCEDCVAACVPR